MNDSIFEKRRALSRTHITKAVFPDTTNHHDTLFGGTAMQWMDEASFISATRFSRKRLVTVSSGRIDFEHPVPAGSMVELVAEVTEVGRTSLTVQVQMWVESMYQDGRKIAISGAFKFVAVDKEMKPTPVMTAISQGPNNYEKIPSNMNDESLAASGLNLQAIFDLDD